MIWEALHHPIALDYHSGRNKRGGGAREGGGKDALSH